MKNLSGVSWRVSAFSTDDPKGRTLFCLKTEARKKKGWQSGRRAQMSKSRKVEKQKTKQKQ
jgi:hypothetical protein